ncbi:peptidylprolyl isomerase [Thermocoleostomius sinensis]|uniref:peptidylprolyl isomerase n=1 Tax=Thermocoleostomius sinensis A174 TaxID=2016057 RepID=A0A9E9C836_9CYAN|nr:peptidylprolyl isomerase [Thermocoleostomius sinensis]WAL61009.1 peptidylprolyl isomerase [Thermocoleostomius sinensis A174]
MTIVLQINHQTITTADLLPLLIRYRMLPGLLRELILDRAIADIKYSDTELTQWQQRSEFQASNICEQDRIRSLKIHLFKQQQWGNQLETYFVERQRSLMQVVYSLIRTPDRDIAYELYFRLQANEQSFANLAAQYSQGPEAETGGLVGPVELGTYHPDFAQLLANCPLGVVSPPLQLDDRFVVLRVEARIPAQLDATVQQRLLDEQLEHWLSEQMQSIELLPSHRNAI